MGGSFPYLKRSSITENDMKSEQALLVTINDEIQLMRERYRF